MHEPDVECQQYRLGAFIVNISLLLKLIFSVEVIQRRCMKIEKKSDANFTGCRPVLSKGVQRRRCWCNDDYCNDERLDPKTVKDRLKCFHCNEGYRACRIKELPAVVTCEPGEVCFRMTTENGKFLHLIILLTF